MGHKKIIFYKKSLSSLLKIGQSHLTIDQALIEGFRLV